MYGGVIFRLRRFVFFLWGGVCEGKHFSPCSPNNVIGVPFHGGLSYQYTYYVTCSLIVALPCGSQLTTLQLQMTPSFSASTAGIKIHLLLHPTV